jgi:hypothetical protein
MAASELVSTDTKSLLDEIARSF